jgi:hypothetical protein
VSPDPAGDIDTRFSDPDAGPTPWAHVAGALDGLDVVVEGTAVRVSEDDALRPLAAAYEAK